MKPSSRRRLSFVAVASTVIVSSLLASCGGSGDSAGESTTAAPTTATATTSTESATTVAETTTTTIPIPTMPLTGLPIEDEILALRPALVAKIDNHPGARPQTGLNQADIVYEENVEKWTRFAVVFHSQGSDPVGPIRSGRTQDIELLTSLNKPLLVWSGGNPTVSRLIQESELVNMSASASQNGGGWFRSKDKKAPHNLFAATTNIWLLDAGRGGTPPAQFTYRTGSEPAAGDEVAGIKLSMDGKMRASWMWDPAKSSWVRNHDDSPHVDSNGEQIAFENVVVLTCEYGYSVADSRSPEAKTTGSGNALVFTDGKMILATWNRPDLRAAWTLLDADGDVIGLTPGQTWVELIRDGQAAVVGAGQSLADVPWPN